VWPFSKKGALVSEAVARATALPLRKRVLK